MFKDLIKQPSALNKKKLILEWETFSCGLTRLSADQYRALISSSLAIEDDLIFYLDLLLLKEKDKRKLRLPTHYEALTNLFGESENEIDEYQTTFSFSFFLEVKKEKEIFDYVLNIQDRHGFLALPIHRLIKEGEAFDRWKFAYHPFKNEFSRQEINLFIERLLNYLQRHFKRCRRLSRQEYIKHIDGAGIIYGYKDGQYFQQTFKGLEYTRALDSLHPMAKNV